MSEMIGLPAPDMDDPDYIKRRDAFMERVKKERWDTPEEKSKSNKGRKPAPSKRIANIDENKPRNNNKFFKYD